MTGLTLVFWEAASSCFTGATYSIMASMEASVQAFTVASTAEVGPIVKVGPIVVLAMSRAA